jgi:beta-glucanase (GH16 family)
VAARAAQVEISSSSYTAEEQQMHSIHRSTVVAVAWMFASGCALLRPGASDLPRTEGGERYRLAWSDEFDRAGLPDTTNWAYESGFVRNQELQWYQRENAIVRNGHLLIEGRRERKPNPRYGAGPSGPNAWRNREMIEFTSSSMHTRGKRAWLYGRFEIRAKIDVRTGSWPAFWTLGTQGPWPTNGEVDIMEFYDDTLLFNVAWAGRTLPVWNSRKVSLREMPAGWADQFHVWRMEWNEQTIKLFVDDRLMTEQDLTRTLNDSMRVAVSSSPAPRNPFHSPMYLLVNLAMGGQHGGDPARSELPLRYEVDYVRVYQTASQMDATRAALRAAR